MQLVLTLAALVRFLPLGRAVSYPPTGSITIGPDGSGAQYNSLTDALVDTSSDVYFVYSGNYTGQHLINRPNLTIYGQTDNALDYNSNTVLFVNARSAGEAGGGDPSGTIRIASNANDVKLYNLNIWNNWGSLSNITQAIALSVQSTGNFACYACKLLGIQDTLLANQGKEFYGKCFIEGGTDFIYGARASIWVHDSTINTIRGGWITAMGRETDDENWYVIDSSVIQGIGSMYLGRPWRDHARVVFQNSVLGSNIVPAGWTTWVAGDPTENIFYAEFNNTGPGAWNSARPAWVHHLTEAVSISTVLGSTSWIDPDYYLG